VRLKKLNKKKMLNAIMMFDVEYGFFDKLCT